MPLVAADIDRLKEVFVTRQERDKDNDCQNAENLAMKVSLAKIDVQLKLVLGVLTAVGTAVLALVVKQFWGA